MVGDGNPTRFIGVPELAVTSFLRYLNPPAASQQCKRIAHCWHVSLLRQRVCLTREAAPVLRAPLLTLAAIWSRRWFCVWFLWFTR